MEIFVLKKKLKFNIKILMDIFVLKNKIKI